jgi:ABC-type transport system substrate-binding protein
VRNPRFRPVPGVPVGNAARIRVSLSGEGDADYALGGGGPELWYVYANTQLPPFDRQAARRAVGFALDREALAAAVGGRPTENVLPPGLPGFVRHASYRHSPARARRLVRQAEAGGSPITVWSQPGPAGRLLAGQLRDAGFAVQRRRLAPEDYFRTVAGREPKAQVGVASWSSPLPHPFRWFDALLDGDRLGEVPNTNLSYADDPELNDRLGDLRARPLLSEEVAAGWAELDRLAVGRALVLPFAVRRERGVPGPRVDRSCRFAHVVFEVDLARVCTRKG